MPKNSSLNNALFDRDLSFDVEKEKAFNEVLKKQKGNYFKFMQGQQEKYWQWHAHMAQQYQLKELQDAIKATEAGTEERMRAEKEYAQRRETVERKTVAIIASIEAEGWRTNFGKRTRELQERRQKEIDESRKQAKAELQSAVEAAAGEENAVDRIKAANKKYRKEVRKALEQEWQLKKDQAEDEQKTNDLLYSRKKKHLDKYVEATKAAEKKAAEERQKYLDMKESGAYTDAEMAEQAEKAKQADADAQKAAEDQKAAEERIRKLDQSLVQFSNKIAQIFHDAETVMTTYQAHMNARLQGSDKAFEDMLDMAVKNTAASPFVKTQDVLDSMKKLNDEGVTYNLEQRAFLGTIADKIAYTFDAFDSNLARLIRLQQADTTAARLGMEAKLTQLFNSMFQDTSYLTSLSGAVTTALTDAQALLTREAAAEFDFVVQKWLGALYSLGLSDQAINSLAQGLNMLGTGDVAGLASNSALQTLFAMSAANADGIEYSQLLLEGLDATKTNKLLESMVTYLKTIAEGSENQVVRAAYGNIFNLSQSDFAALSNLTRNDISEISTMYMSYANMRSELDNQLSFSNLYKRASWSEMISNVTDNALFAMGKTMVTNPVLFITNKMLDVLDSLNVRIPIPGAFGMGNGLQMNASINDLIRLGTGGIGALGMIGSILSSLGAGLGSDLSAWGGTEYTLRGGGLGLLTTTSLGGSSGTAYVASSNSGALQDSALSEGTSDAEETTKVTNKNNKTENTFDDFYKATIGEKATEFIVVHDDTLAKVYSEEGGYLNVHDQQLENIVEAIESLATSISEDKIIGAIRKAFSENGEEVVEEFRSMLTDSDTQFHICNDLITTPHTHAFRGGSVNT